MYLEWFFMNFLAHLYLSGNDPKVQIGNFIGDHVKGRQYEKYPAKVQTGILLHRQIDAYTDSHPVVKQSIQKLNGRYRKYAGIVIDVFYDHFLAVHWSSYHELPLEKYVTKVHKTLLTNYFGLPKPVRGFLPFMVKSRRLETYATRDGIERSLRIMSSYSSLPDETDWAMAVLDREYDSLQNEFLIFFEDVRKMATSALAELTQRSPNA